jgi:HEAT repeat protein
LKSRSDLDHAGRDALLQAYLKDTEVRVRNAAAITLAHLGETSAEFLSALQQAVDGEDEQARKTAATALALIKKIRSSGK